MRSARRARSCSASARRRSSRQHFALRHPKSVAGMILVAGTHSSWRALPPEQLEDRYERAGSADAMKEVDPQLRHRAGRRSSTRPLRPRPARIPRAALKGRLQTTLESDFSSELTALDYRRRRCRGTQRVLHHRAAPGHDRLKDPRRPDGDPRLRPRGPDKRPRELAVLIEAFLAGLGTPNPKRLVRDRGGYRGTVRELTRSM